MNESNHQTINARQPWLAGFWMRFFALTIDLLIIGIFGFLLGLLLEDFFSSLGTWGRGIGYAIALIYFGILNSDLGNGQTLGKRLLKLKVVDQHNQSISVFRSLIRSSILFLPYFLNGFNPRELSINSSLTYILAVIIFGLGLNITYLYIFNRQTRQSLHDLVVQSYVVKTDRTPLDQLQHIWKTHYLVVVCLFFVAGILPIVIHNFSSKFDLNRIEKVREIVLQNENFQNARATYGNHHQYHSTGKTITSYFRIWIILKNKHHLTNENLARSIAETIKTSFPNADTLNVIRVDLVYGFDIGIANKWTTHSYNYTPTDIN